MRMSGDVLESLVSGVCRRVVSFRESHERIQDGSERNAPKKIVLYLCKLLFFAILCD